MAKQYVDWDRGWDAIKDERDELRVEVKTQRDHIQTYVSHIGQQAREIERLREKLLNCEAETEALESIRAGDDLAIETLMVENKRLRAALRDSLEKATARAPADCLAELAPLWAILND